MCGGFMGKLLGTSVKTPKIAAAPTAVTTVTGEDVLSAARSAKQKAASAEGLQSTIVTSPLGVTDTATTQKKSLLGG